MDKEFWLSQFDLEQEDYDLEPSSAGMPRKFKSPAEMADKIAQYFADQDEAARPYTMYGLALKLKFYNLADLNRYQGYSDRFKRVIKIAQTIILSGYEQMLFERGMGSGPQFGLMNLGGWSKNEKSEVTHKDLSISFKQQEPDEE
jgi:hypothetical protein